MLQGFFNYENPVWRAVARIADFMILNVLWIICCLPVFTIGASTTALYYCTLKIVRDEDYGNFRMFLRSFRQNFKQATVIWLIMSVLGLVLGFDYYFFGQVMQGHDQIRFLFRAVVGAIGIFWVFELLYVFPILSRFDNTIRKTMTNAAYMSVRYIGSTLGMLLTDGLLVFFVYLSMYYLPQLTMVLLLIGFPAIAWVNSTRLEHIFKDYMPAEIDPKDEPLRPILTDVVLSDRDDASGGAGQQAMDEGRQDMDDGSQDAALADEAPKGEDLPGGRHNQGEDTSGGGV